LWFINILFECLGFTDDRPPFIDKHRPGWVVNLVIQGSRMPVLHQAWSSMVFSIQRLPRCMERQQTGSLTQAILEHLTFTP